MDDTTRRRFLRRSAAFTGLALATPAVAAWAAGPPADDAVIGAAGTQPAVDVADPTTAAFLAAVAAGRIDEVRAQLAARPTLANAHDAPGRSALVLALLGQHTDVADALLERGADVGLVEAVMLADWERATEWAERDPSRLDAWHPVGGTPLYAVARAGHASFYRLQDLGADPDANPAGRLGVTPAYGALQCPRASDALRTLVALLSNGAHANAPQRGGDSLLHAAARRGDPAIVRYLLRRGADADARDDHFASPVDLARAHGRVEAAALLAQPDAVPRDDMTTRYAEDASGAPVQWPDLSDVTQAQQSAVTGPSHFDLDAVRAAVADEPRRSFSRSTQGELAVEACGHMGNRAIMRYHLDHGVPQSLCTSLSLGDLARARSLLARHPHAIHERGPHDFAPLWYAVIGRGGVEAAELLLAAGVPVDQESTGTTTLHWAAQAGQLDLIAWLVERGADIDAVGYKFERDGQTPLQSARERGRDDAARLLVDLGARG